MNNAFKFSSNINHQQLSIYGAYLFSNIHNAQYLKFLDVLIYGEKAKKKECHKNAICFTKENKSFQLVHGWFIVDPRPTFQSIKFIAHSVVRSSSGNLIDITPSDALETYLFLPAMIENEDFEYLVSWLNQKHMNGSFNYQIT